MNFFIRVVYIYTIVDRVISYAGFTESHCYLNLNILFDSQ